ncbi:hypothetical protein I3842_09G187900 [Carya illinoinensis]|uniref:Uncharacterized protein n=1 Tax=Carya illinoinensis TaxID=32201 RepID=A0A922E8J7_CARIL|nr:hypothetical protein I3842_09G187900 [Carya illinoinensis]
MVAGIAVFFLFFRFDFSNSFLFSFLFSFFVWLDCFLFRFRFGLVWVYGISFSPARLILSPVSSLAEVVEGWFRWLWAGDGFGLARTKELADLVLVCGFGCLLTDAVFSPGLVVISMHRGGEAGSCRMVNGGGGGRCRRCNPNGLAWAGPPRAHKLGWAWAGPTGIQAIISLFAFVF